ncbi:SDR family oxidoreductase [Aquamicrobium sp.]|jgi:gluconate 5-dehydrogenase|uniref:SDR family NAD(P)-dependent oxidoreductase n=1 Tax=Aquamicrobium sp. TaxID=1872579 RepID=UPI0025888A26|nr:SDR family oxidoreductase [Aquamicrobium sp.]MCK9549330.1 SDR family oxidoreductase [Aquamicrobium sp.]
MSALFDLSNRVAIVTGGGKGLGAAMARAISDAGATVVLAGRSPAPLETTVADIRSAGGQADHRLCDVTRREDVDALISDTAARYGRIDILINNAGITGRSAFADVTDGDWSQMIATHMTGPFMACRAVVPVMQAQGAGKIINTVSVVGELGRPWVVPYSSAKGGLRMLTRALATEVAGSNIQVNGIGPGYFVTEMNTRIMEDRDFYEERVSRVPARRWGEPEELGGVTVFLASKASDYVCGQIIYVDGGLTASF